MSHGIGSRERTCARAAATHRLRVEVCLRFVFPNIGTAERLRDPFVVDGAFEVVLYVNINASDLPGTDKSAALLANDDGNEAERVAFRSDGLADDVHVLHLNERICGVGAGRVGLHEEVALPRVVRRPQVFYGESSALPHALCAHVVSE